MGQDLPPEKAELYQRCDEVLHYIWDPIGVSGTPGARDEYHAYLPHVFRMVMGNATADQIGAYLDDVSANAIGLSAPSRSTQNAAHALVSWRAWMQQRSR